MSSANGRFVCVCWGWGGWVGGSKDSTHGQNLIPYKVPVGRLAGVKNCILRHVELSLPQY